MRVVKQSDLLVASAEALLTPAESPHAARPYVSEDGSLPRIDGVEFSDLRAALDQPAPRPTLLRRTDGKYLLYPNVLARPVRRVGGREDLVRVACRL